MARGARRGEAEVSGLEAHAGFWLRLVSNQVSARFARLVEAEGVSVSEWVALRQLFDAEQVTTAALVASLGLTKGAISKVIARLEQKGLVRRLADADDGRVQHVALTRAGRALVPRLAALADANDRHFFQSLSAAERTRLVDTLRAVAAHHHLTQFPID